MSKHRVFPSMPARRRALRQLGGLGALGLVPSLSGVLGGEARASASSYQALVCVFLFGGNDGNNMIVPTDTAGYNAYFLARGNVLGTPENGALALPAAGTTGGVLPMNGINFGLHPSMPEIQALWNSGNVALVFNAGALVQPITVAQYQANVRNPDIVPENLFSHFDQQQQMQTTSIPGFNTTGWAGRMVDQFGGASASIPAAVSAAGNTVLLAGNSSSPIVVPQTGPLAYNGFNGTALANARLAALQTLFTTAGDATLDAALGTIQTQATATAQLLSPVLSGTSTLSSYFPLTSEGELSGLSNQLLQVARLVQAASSGAISAPSRQIFFVDMQEYDTHNNQLNRQAPLLADLSASLSGFYNAMVSLGLQNQVTSFTLSDFARTLKPASGGGSDHAWGSHHIVVGGPATIRSGTYGSFPQLVLGGASDISGEGRWLPGISIDQYGATLGKWLGLSTSQLATAFPNLANFPTADLGFLAPLA
jgi:uncharacterized protein (DUF1501 family)